MEYRKVLGEYMDGRTELIGVRTTTEIKRELGEFCLKHKLTESEAGEAAIKYFLTCYNSIGPVKMLIHAQEVLR